MGHGTTTFREGLCNSCNPWFMHIGSLLGGEAFCRYREAFGMTDKTGIDLPGESYSIYHNFDEMRPVDLAVESFGQNFSITPIQMITARPWPTGATWCGPMWWTGLWTAMATLSKPLTPATAAR